MEKADKPFDIYDKFGKLPSVVLFDKLTEMLDSIKIEDYNDCILVYENFYEKKLLNIFSEKSPYLDILIQEDEIMSIIVKSFIRGYFEYLKSHMINVDVDFDFDRLSELKKGCWPVIVKDEFHGKEKRPLKGYIVEGLFDKLRDLQIEIDILQDKIIKTIRKYPEYPSHYKNVPDNYVLISKGDDLEAKWVHLYDECGEIGTWNHPSLKAWQRFREILLNKKCK